MHPRLRKRPSFALENGTTSSLRSRSRGRRRNFFLLQGQLTSFFSREKGETGGKPDASAWVAPAGLLNGENSWPGLGHVLHGSHQVAAFLRCERPARTGQPQSFKRNTSVSTSYGVWLRTRAKLGYFHLHPFASSLLGEMGNLSSSDSCPLQPQRENNNTVCISKNNTSFQQMDG